MTMILGRAGSAACPARGREYAPINAAKRERICLINGSQLLASFAG
jgi:hypothetical protein